MMIAARDSGQKSEVMAAGNAPTTSFREGVIRT